jgi:hypothetical protein
MNSKFTPSRNVSNVMPDYLPDTPKSIRDFLLIVETEIIETAPPGAETWIKHRKQAFKDRYGKRWKRVLYAKAWKLFPRHNQ